MDVADIKRLAQQTGVGLTAAKAALVKAGSFEQALTQMQAKGLAKVASRADRPTSAGQIAAYVHEGRIGVLVELACETDFVARNQLFGELAHNLCLQVAASNPQHLSQDTLPRAVVTEQTKVITKAAQEEDLPADKLDQVVAGRLAKQWSEICLLEQVYIKETSQKVSDYLAQVSAQLGERIVIERFCRFALGQ